MIDPSCEDITGRALEALHAIGVPARHAAVRRAAAFLDEKQLADGTWYGRWGCNYLYGSFLALRGLLHAGEDLRLPRFQKTAEWIRAHQNADGGWGELPLSYDDPSTNGQGPSTPSQTAWALVALFATGDRDSESVRRGVAYLLAKQQYDGSWKDDHWTATGFPKVFYLRYHLYATVFPLRALALYERQGASAPASDALVAGASLHGDHGVN
jgi:squalene-hopene/tetraprenyl-beta-curcumene cyclase